ncbi:MAG: hypothetical protein ACTSP4_14040, partial [Candidatus Hodarchaeales archaeon]
MRIKRSLALKNFIIISIVLFSITGNNTIVGNSSINELDSDDDGIIDQIEQYLRRNISITKISSGLAVNSNWTRPSDSEYDLKRYFTSLFPGNSGNTVQTQISTNNGLSIKYILFEIFKWNNVTVYSEICNMTIHFQSIIEYNDKNNNDIHDMGDESISEFNISASKFNYRNRSVTIDNEEVKLITFESNESTSIFSLQMKFSDRFYRIPDSDLKSSPINDYAKVKLNYPFISNESKLALKISFDWPRDTEYCDRPLTDLIWNSSISSSGFKTGYDNNVIMEMVYWYYSLIFSWGDSAVKYVRNLGYFNLSEDLAKMFDLDEVQRNKTRIDSLDISFDKNDTIMQEFQFGLLNYIDDLDIVPKKNSLVFSIENCMMIIVIA